MTLESDKFEISKLLPFGVNIDDLLREPMSFIGKEIETLIPSLQVSANGIALEAIFGFVDNLLIEIRVMPQKTNFDIIINNFRNLRVKLEKLKLPNEESEENIYYSASVEVLHDGLLRTTINYVGINTPDEWLRRVKEKFSIASLKS